MKILHIYKDYYPPVLGGIETHINALATGMAHRHEISVLVCGKGWQTTRENLDGVTVVRIGCPIRAFSNPFAPCFPYWLRRLDADILHFHLPLPTATVAWQIARPKGKVIVTYHSDIVRQSWALAAYGPLQQAFLRKAFRILVTSPNYLQSSTHLQSHRERCRVVPLGMDLALFEPNEAVIRHATMLREQWGSRVVLFVGKLRYYKGLTYLISAMKSVNATLVLVGGGPLETQLRRQAQEEGISERVVFVGDMERDQLPSYYYACDLFCLPSIYRSEAFGLVQIEAAACAKPVVSTALASGVPYVNQHEKTGLIVPPQNPEALAQAINTLLDDPALSQRMGSYARERAFREFTLEKMLERVESIYEEC